MVERKSRDFAIIKSTLPKGSILLGFDDFCLDFVLRQGGFGGQFVSLCKFTAKILGNYQAVA